MDEEADEMFAIAPIQWVTRDELAEMYPPPPHAKLDEQGWEHYDFGPEAE